MLLLCRFSILSWQAIEILNLLRSAQLSLLCFGFTLFLLSACYSSASVWTTGQPLTLPFPRLGMWWPADPWEQSLDKIAPSASGRNRDRNPGKPISPLMKLRLVQLGNNMKYLLRPIQPTRRHNSFLASVRLPARSGSMTSVCKKAAGKCGGGITAVGQYWSMPPAGPNTSIWVRPSGKLRGPRRRQSMTAVWSTG